jgi:hypothetical protein
MANLEHLVPQDRRDLLDQPGLTVHQDCLVRLVNQGCQVFLGRMEHRVNLVNKELLE